MHKKRILQMTIVNQRSGMTQYAMRNWEYIDKSRFHFDFVTFSKKLDFEEELTRTGSKVHYMPCYADEDEARFISEMRNILKQGYDGVHLHTGYWKNFLVEELAIQEGIPLIIVHAHSNMVSIDDPSLRQRAINRHEQQKALFMPHHATHFLACAQTAADWLFGPSIPRDKIRILKNAINTERFAYNPAVRDTYRRELGIEADFVIGHVGRFAYQKNHDALIDIFCGVKDRVQNAKLLLVGDGDLMDEVKRKAGALGLTDSVLYMGRQPDTEVPRLMQAMDMFCLPSRFGGLDLVLVEAQAAGLKCLASDIMPQEAAITPNIAFLPPDTDAWVSAANEIAKGYHRQDGSADVAAKGYDLGEQIKILESLYEGGM